MKDTKLDPEKVQRAPGEFNLAWAGTTITKYWDKLVSGIVLPVTAMVGKLADLVIKDNALGEVAYAFAVVAVEAREAYTSAKAKSPQQADAWLLAGYKVVAEAFGAAGSVYHQNVGSLPKDKQPVGSDGKAADKEGNITLWAFDRTTMAKAVLEAASTDDNPLDVDNETVVKSLLNAIEYAGKVWAEEKNLTMPRQRIKQSKGGGKAVKPVQLTFTSGVKGAAGERPNFAFALPSHVEGLFNLVKPAGAAKLVESLAGRIMTSDKGDERLTGMVVGILPMLSDNGLLTVAAAIVELRNARKANAGAKGKAMKDKVAALTAQALADKAEVPKEAAA